MMTNPYIVGRPVWGEDHHGRIALLNQVLAGRGHCWPIVGLRRFGKTSFLYQLDYLRGAGGARMCPSSGISRAVGMRSNSSVH